MLFVTYQQLVKDTFKIARVAKLSRIAIYDQKGRLVSFALFDQNAEQVGFVEHSPAPLVQIATLKDGEELTRDNLKTINTVTGIALKFGSVLPRQQNVHYSIADGMPAIESYAPIMGVSLDAISGKQTTTQLGMVLMVQRLDQRFIDQLSRLTDVKIKLFGSAGISRGSLPDYRSPDWNGVQQNDGFAMNEIRIGQALYHQHLIPLYNDKQLIGTIAVLNSEEVVQKNISELITTLALIALISLMLVLPFAWYLARSISRPITALSKIFRGVASDKEMLSHEIRATGTDDELGDLTQSFIAMNEAIKQKIRQINEINASLEEKVSQRTSELRLANTKLTKLATHDTLTGLPNRQLVYDRLSQALVSARRDRVRVAVMFIDLDEFKPVNDQFGHAVGDQLLKEVAKRIQTCIRESDTVSRIGGDEFIVLLPVIEAEQDAQEVAEKIRSALNQPFELAEISLHISSSIGISIYPEHGHDESALLKNADTAMYDAKNNGRNAVRLYQTQQT